MSNTWTHRDLLRLSHPKGLDENVVNFILRKPFTDGPVPEIMRAFEALQASTNEKEVVRKIKEYKNVTWEMLPTKFLKSKDVWKTLFYEGIPQTALLRNVRRLHEIGAFDDLVFAADVAKALSDKQRIEKGRIHPINYLNAYVKYAGDPTYQMWYGHRYHNYSAGLEGNNKIIKALEDGYEAAFKSITPANKRTLMGLDISGSMSNNAAGIDISCALLGACFSQTVVKREPYAMIRGFSDSFIDLGISDSDSLKQVMAKTGNKTFGRTDCSLPMQWALQNGIEIDTFAIFTDNDTWAGREHPHEALNRYRKETGIPARLIVVASAGSWNTIGDPNDAGTLNLSGFDSSAPKVLADFSAGRI